MGKWRGDQIVTVAEELNGCEILSGVAPEGTLASFSSSLLSQATKPIEASAMRHE